MPSDRPILLIEGRHPILIAILLPLVHVGPAFPRLLVPGALTLPTSAVPLFQGLPLSMRTVEWANTPAPQANETGLNLIHRIKVTSEKHQNEIVSGQNAILHHMIMWFYNMMVM